MNRLNPATRSGGQSLHGHSMDEKVKKFISAKNWRFVVLQDQSTAPGGADAKLYADTLLSLATFYAPRLPAGPTGGEVLLYSTWGHRDGARKGRAEHKAAYPNFLSMQGKTAAGYVAYKAALLAEVPELRVSIVPVGLAYELVYRLEEAAGRDPLHAASAAVW